MLSLEKLGSSEMTARIYCSYSNPDQLEKYPPDWDDAEVEVVTYDTTVGIGPEKINALHPYWSDYVCMYDVWKNNLKTDFVGFEQYSRRLDYSMLVNDSEKCNVFHSVDFPKPIADIYDFFHDGRDIVSLAQILIEQSGTDPSDPLSNPYVKYLFTERTFYSESTFFMSWDKFTEMANFVFSTLLQYDKENGLDLDPAKYEAWTKERFNTASYKNKSNSSWEYQRRIFGYLAERLVSAYIFTHFKRDQIIKSSSDHTDYSTFIRKKYLNGDYDAPPRNCSGTTYLLKYDDGALGDTLALLPFVKDFTEQRPNDRLFVSWTTSNMLWHKQRDLVFSHLNCLEKYDGVTPVDKTVLITAKNSLPEIGKHSSILDRPYAAFEKIGVCIEKHTNRVPWDFKPGEIDILKYSDKKPFAIVNVGFHAIVSSKNWGVIRYQELVDRLRDKINFVQVGETVINGFRHDRLDGTSMCLLNQTTIPQLAVLMHRADFVFTNVTGTNIFATIPSYKKRHVFTFCGNREPSRFFDRIKSDDLDYRLLRSNNDYSECFEEHEDYCNVFPVGKCKHQVHLSNGETICACFNDITVDSVVAQVNEILEQEFHM